jgi:signal transduction histidine kinase
MLRVCDGGAGFDKGAATCGNRLGLRSMGDRVYDFGGTLHLTSEPGVGTEVMVYLPPDVIL